MRLNPKCPLYVIDLGGIAMLGLLLIASAWLMFWRGDATRSELGNLRAAVTESEKALTGLNATRDQRKAALTAKHQEMAERGRLPENTPVEEYFQTLSAWASQNGLSVLRHQPLGFRAYPGLQERRYAYEVSGGYDGLVRFLRAIECSAFWADVSYLRINSVLSGSLHKDQKSPHAEKAHAEGRVALLTMSVFSAAPEKAAEQD